ncbi:MAG TPA: metallophosphoesterase [Planctomycetota bacterium]|nr:metallophosphoesterase [Planctomycetota bacterium]
MLRSLARPALMFVLVAASVAPAAPDGHENGSDRFEFCLIGDTPYGAGANSSGDEEKFQRLLDDVNADNKIAFVLHTGDIKTGSSLDTNALIESRFALYQKFNAPFIYTPGDNEWTDAHRQKEGWYNPIERLDFVRKTFYPNPGWSTGAHPMKVATQASDPGFSLYVENQMWVRSGVVFACIHVVGSNDSLDRWTLVGHPDTDKQPTVTPEQQAEFDGRRAANLAWIDKAFALADQIHAKGVFLFTQADMAFEAAKGSALRAVFDPVLDKLFAKTVAFGKPVMFAHGDSHYFRVDMPALDAAPTPHTIENFTRVENFGELNVHWVKITVDPNSRNVFLAEPVLVPGNSFTH